MPNDIVAELSELVVSILNLEQSANMIDPKMSLFGEDGIGLDSIDILELSLAISKRYGFQLRSDGDNNKIIFSNLTSLANHIAQHRTK